jgi:hypothetical protein
MKLNRCKRRDSRVKNWRNHQWIWLYSITIPKGNYTVQISYLGYLTISESIYLKQNIKKTLIYSVMKPLYNITDNKTKLISKTRKRNKLSISASKKMPVVLWSRCFKIFCYFPELQMLAKASGFNVRWWSRSEFNFIGRSDHILIHRVLFFLCFNPDAKI